VLPLDAVAVNSAGRRTERVMGLPELVASSLRLVSIEMDGGQRPPAGLAAFA
jgi:hypothetical protein